MRAGCPAPTTAIDEEVSAGAPGAAAHAISATPRHGDSAAVRQAALFETRKKELSVLFFVEITDREAAAAAATLRCSPVFALVQAANSNAATAAAALRRFFDDAVFLEISNGETTSASATLGQKVCHWSCPPYRSGRLQPTFAAVHTSEASRVCTG